MERKNILQFFSQKFPCPRRSGESGQRDDWTTGPNRIDVNPAARNFDKLSAVEMIARSYWQRTQAPVVERVS